MKFLNAHWKHLILANYRISPEFLERYVPLKTTLDFFQGDCYISLVAFLFDQTRVLGIPVPGHRCFEEVNLRFYVTPDRDRSLRAVSFLKEIVPRATIPLIANNLFYENYVAMPMGHEFLWGASSDRANPKTAPQQVTYTWGIRQQNRISACIDKPLHLPPAGSLGEFITEHYWGYAKGSKKTLEYRVEHPPWVSCSVEDVEIQVDFRESYGDEFAFLRDEKPASVLYALGSAVSVSFPSIL